MGEEVAKVTGLTKRNSVYYYRTRIPKEVQTAFADRTEVWESLHTTDYSKAAPLAKLAGGKWTAAFEEAREQLKADAEANPKAKSTRHKCRNFTKDDAERLARAWLQKEAANIDEDLKGAYANYKKEELAFVQDDLRADIATYYDPNHPGTISDAQNLAAALIHENDLPPPPKEIWPLFQDYLRRAMLELARHEEDIFWGNTPGKIRDSLFAQSNAANKSANAPDKSLKDLSDTFWDREMVPKELSPKTTVKYRAALDLILNHFGPLSNVSDITREQCREFQDIVSKLPPRFALHYPDLSIQEIAKIADEKNLKRMAYDTQSQYLSHMFRLFECAVNDDCINKNPATNLRPLTKKLSAADARDPFTAEQLQLIFSAPIYTGCVDDEYRFSKPGPNIIRRARFWLPLIALFTGMRMGEILQLHSDDIKKSSKGVPYIHIHKGMRLKTPNAAREVPIHPELVRIGFLKFADKQGRKGNGALFPDVPLGSDGYQSSTFSKRFETFLSACKAHDRG